MNREEYLLDKLKEECAEVAQRACKSVQFGPYEIQEGQELTNRRRLRDEINDLMTVIEIIKTETDHIELMSPKQVGEAMRFKREKIEKYHRLSVSLGRVQDECL